MLGELRSSTTVLPKGLSKDTLDLVSRTLKDAGELGAAEVAEMAGLSRVTARRYLEHLAEQKRPLGDGSGSSVQLLQVLAKSCR